MESITCGCCYYWGPLKFRISRNLKQRIAATEINKADKAASIQGAFTTFPCHMGNQILSNSLRFSSLLQMPRDGSEIQLSRPSFPSLAGKEVIVIDDGARDATFEISSTD